MSLVVSSDSISLHTSTGSSLSSWFTLLSWSSESKTSTQRATLPIPCRLPPYHAAIELETLAVIWSVSHFHAYLYSHDVVVYTDHSAVQAVLEIPSSNGKHARWWSKLFGAGLKCIKIVYRAGQDSKHADAISKSPLPQASSDGNTNSLNDANVAAIKSLEKESIEFLLQAQPANVSSSCDLAGQQLKDPDLCQLIHHMNKGTLPADENKARKIAAQAPSFSLLNGILYFVDSKNKNRKRCVVPVQMRQQLMEENHSGPMAGHFSADKLYKTMATHWWWQLRYVYRCCKLLYVLSTMCNCEFIRQGEWASTTPHPSIQTVPNYWSRCDGLATY